MSLSLKSARLQNFRVHSDLEIEFPQGVTLITAPNGGGKSSLVEAMDWALWGPKGLRSNQANVIREGADRAAVDLVLDVDSEPRTFSRALTLAGTASAKLTGPDGTIATSPSGVQEYLLEQGLDRTGYSIHYAAQRELSYFVFETPAVRKQLLSSLLPLAHIESAISSARDWGRSLSREVEGSPAPSHVEKARERAAQLLEEAMEAEVELAGLKASKAESEQQIEILQESLHDAARDALEEEAGHLERELQRCRQDLQDVGEEAPVPPPVLRNPAAFQDARARLLAFEESCRAALEEFTLGERQMAERIELLEGGDCPTCSRPLDGLWMPIEALRQHRAEAASGVNHYRRLISAVRGRAGRAGELAAELRTQKIDREGALNRNQVIQERRSKLELRIWQLSESLESAREALKGFPDLSETSHRLQILRARLSGTNGAIADALAELTRTETRYEMEQQLQSLEDSYRGSVRARRKLGRVEPLLKHLPEFRDEMIRHSLGWVGARASSLLHAATGQEWPVEIDSNLEFFARGRPLVDHSTGQIDTVCVCLRVALTEFLSRRLGLAGFMILDGVLDRIDEDNRDALGVLLGEINMPQVVILSHFDVDVDGHHVRLG